MYILYDVKMIPLKDTSNDVYSKFFLDPIYRSTMRQLTEIWLCSQWLETVTFFEIF